jgi:hypothetical protein
VRYYGRELASLLARDIPGAKGQTLDELARFEWALAEAFDAADRSPLAVTDLQRIAAARWPQLRFEFTPSLRRLSLHTNAVQWWKAASAGDVRPTRWRRGVRAREWMLWRRDLKTYFRSLKSEEARLLDAAAAGESFGALCTDLSGRPRSIPAPLRAATLLHTWLAEGIIVRADA